MEKRPAIYMMANKRNGTLYTGVTSDLINRVYQHKNAMTPGFTRRYDCKLLVYYEAHEEMLSAIAREKQIKAGSRKKKIALIESILSGLIYTKESYKVKAWFAASRKALLAMTGHLCNNAYPIYYLI
jgi:putative endonuclease